jgi:hypothetical protein
MYTAVSEAVGRRIAPGDPDPMGNLRPNRREPQEGEDAHEVPDEKRETNRGHGSGGAGGVRGGGTGARQPTVKIDSKVTLPPQPRSPFHGRVKSSEHACEVHRLVKVFRRRPGRDWFVDGDVKDRTNQRGKWRVGQDVLPAGKYYAKVLRRKEGTAGTTFVCRGDRSPTRHVPHQG